MFSKKKIEDKSKPLQKFVSKYKHYVIAVACVLTLAIVLFLTFVYPHYCQNVKFRFLDGSKAIANTKFRVYKFVYNTSHNSIPPEYLITTIKTDSQGYAHLNMAHIEDKMLLIENKDYITGIMKYTKWRIKVINYHYDHRKGVFFGKNIYNLLTGWVVHAKEKTRKYDYIKLSCFNAPKAINMINKSIVNYFIRKVHTIEKFRKHKPALVTNNDLKFTRGTIVFIN